jgi:hypothetical protein
VYSVCVCVCVCVCMCMYVCMYVWVICAHLGQSFSFSVLVYRGEMMGKFYDVVC